MTEEPVVLLSDAPAPSPDRLATKYFSLELGEVGTLVLAETADGSLCRVQVRKVVRAGKETYRKRLIRIRDAAEVAVIRALMDGGHVNV